MDAKSNLDKNLILKCVAGSRAYGTSTPTSDWDFRGIFIADRVNVIPPFFPVEQIEGEGDTVFYELRKYVKLLVDQNPNIVELLWGEREDIVHSTPAYEILRGNRENLLSSKLKHTFSGYAFAQLKRIKGHNKWINNPQPEESPEPKDFVSVKHNFTPERRLNNQLPSNQGHAAVSMGDDLFMIYAIDGETWHNEDGSIRMLTREQVSEKAGADLWSLPPVMVAKFNRDVYKDAKANWSNYWTWKENRNEKRSELEERYGFDTKHAAHLVRLLRMGCEAMTEGIIRVRRPDAEELLAIRNGSLTYEQVVEMAEELDAKMNDAYKNNSLPRSVSPEFASDLVMELYEEHWKALSRAKKPKRLPFYKAPDINERLVVIDIEHTGHRDIVEIAATELVGGRLSGNSFHSYVDPGRVKFSPFAVDVHGLKPSFLKGKPKFDEVAKRFLEFVDGAVMVMHDAKSDVSTLNHAFDKVGVRPIDKDAVACTQKIAKRLGLGNDVSLDTLCDLTGVDRSARARGHSAAVDASLTAECMIALAAFEGYDYLENVSAKASTKDKEATNVKIDLDYEAGRVTFTTPEGETFEADIPDYPKDTHFLSAGKFGQIAVFPKGVHKAKPDNPDGPAVVGVKKGQLMKVYFEDGVPSDRQEPEAPSI